MTSSDDMINATARMVENTIRAYVTSPLGETSYLEVLAASAAMSAFVEGMDDWWPSLIARSETSRPTFQLLCRFSARFINTAEPIPRALEAWLVDYLSGHRREPTSGKRGPNRAAFEHILLLGLVQKVASETGLPVWPSASQVPNHNAIAIVALGSKRVKNAGLCPRLPAGEKAMETRFIKARHWLAGNDIKN